MRNILINDKNPKFLVHNVGVCQIGGQNLVPLLACNIAASSHLHETLRLNKKVISPAYKHGLTMVLYSLKILLQPIDLA